MYYEEYPLMIDVIAREKQLKKMASRMEVEINKKRK